MNRGAAAHLDELSRQAQEIWDYLERGVDLAWEKCVTAAAFPGKAEELVIDKERFGQEMPAVQTQLLRRCLARVRGHEKDIGSVHVTGVAELFGKQAGRKIDLPGDVQAERMYAGVRIAKRGRERERICRPSESAGGDTDPGDRTADRVPVCGRRGSLSGRRDPAKKLHEMV